MMKATQEVLFVRPFHNPSPRFLTYFVVNLKGGSALSLMSSPFQMMETLRHHCLLVALFLPVLMAMPEPVSEEGWEPPDGSPPMPLSIPPMHGPGRPFYHNRDNSTDPPAGSLEAYCQMLLQVPVPSDQIPWFCLCTHCQNNQGPKGDRGDRGPPGTQHRTTVSPQGTQRRDPALPVLTQVILEVLEEEA